MRILIVDDDPAVRRYLIRLLQEMEYGLGEASSRSEAMAVFKIGEFSTALIDVNLGADDGIKLALVLQNLDPALNLIVMSGDATNEDRVKEAGLERMIFKPIMAEELRKRLREQRQT